MTVTEQTMERASTVRASVELNERGSSVSMDGTFHSRRRPRHRALHRTVRQLRVPHQP